jgi:hypothetical protein
MLFSIYMGAIMLIFMNQKNNIAWWNHNSRIFLFCKLLTYCSVSSWQHSLLSHDGTKCSMDRETVDIFMREDIQLYEVVSFSLFSTLYHLQILPHPPLK